MQVLKQELSRDPVLLSKVKEATKATIETLVADANALFDAIGSAGIAKLKEAQQRAAATRDAAKAAAAVLSE